MVNLALAAIFQTSKTVIENWFYNEKFLDLKSDIDIKYEDI